jgi:hypothetical protein
MNSLLQTSGPAQRAIPLEPSAYVRSVDSLAAGVSWEQKRDAHLRPATARQVDEIVHCAYTDRLGKR